MCCICSIFVQVDKTLKFKTMPLIYKNSTGAIIELWVFFITVHLYMKATLIQPHLYTLRPLNFAHLTSVSFWIFYKWKCCHECRVYNWAWYLPLYFLCLYCHSRLTELYCSGVGSVFIICKILWYDNIVYLRYVYIEMNSSFQNISFTWVSRRCAISTKKVD